MTVVTTAPAPRADATAPDADRGVVRNAPLRGAGLVAALAVLAVLVVLSIAVGSKYLAPTAVWDALFGTTDADTHFVVWDVRVPRTVAGLAVGTALGVAGALIQALTRNPLADPGILGVNAGAAFFVVLGIGVFGAGSVAGYVWFAFAGALIVTVSVYLIGSAGRGPAEPVRLVLAGVALGAVLAGLTTAMMLFDRETFDRMRNWQAGSVVGRDLDVVATVAPFLGIGLILAALSARQLNAIALGEDLASSLGAHVTRTRVLVVVAVTLLAGGATAIAGPIGFIGLMTPHVARWIVGPDQRWVLMYTAVLTPVLLLTADIAGRLIMRPGEIPVGIVTAFVGAPVLIALVRRTRASGL